MRKRIVIPYLMVILLFAVLYVMTQAVPNHLLRLCKDCQVPGWNKLTLQEAVFTVGLTLMLVLVNMFQILTVRKDDFSPRFYLSLSTVILVYGLNGLIFLLFFDSIDVYSYPAGGSAPFYGLVTFVLTDGALLILDGIKVLVFKCIKEEDLKAILPEGLIEK